MQLQNVVFSFWMGGELSAIPRAKRDSYSGITTLKLQLLAASQQLENWRMPVIGNLEAKYWFWHSYINLHSLTKTLQDPNFK